MQLERFLTSNDYETELVFHRVSVDGVPVRIKINRDDLLGFDIKIWGASPHLSKSDFNLKLLDSNLIKTRVKTLASIIKDNGGKVRLYTTISINNDANGIQYVKPDINNEKFKYLDRPPGYTSQAPHYFEVDLSDKTASLRTLEKIIGLTLGFSTQPGPNIKDFLFIMKGVDPTSGEFYTWAHQEMICAFDGRKFYDIDELYSPSQYVISKPNYGYEKVDIYDFEGTFNLDRANNLWSLFKIFIPFSVDQRDFFTYFSFDNSLFS
jgi:hypothetical protein